MNHIDIHSLEETRALAEAMAAACQDKTLTICLDGDLGAGKTTWTKAFGKALGVKGIINSPTFTIMKAYKMKDGRTLTHIDAYRLEGAHQDLGFEECFEDGLTVIEWGTFIADQIPADHLQLSITEGLEEERQIEMEACGAQANQVLEALQPWIAQHTSSARTESGECA